MEKELFRTSIVIANPASQELELNMTEAEGRDLPSLEEQSVDGSTVSIYCCCCCSC